MQTVSEAGNVYGFTTLAVISFRRLVEGQCHVVDPACRLGWLPCPSLHDPTRHFPLLQDQSRDHQKAEWKTDIEPDTVFNDVRREPVAAINQWVSHA
jgi:hypothetical protein